MPITTCDSPEILKIEIDSVRKKVTLDESEETWDAIAQGILRLTILCRIGGCQFPAEMVIAIRSLSRPLNNALSSERSRLSGATVELVTALATGLGPSFEPLASQFVPSLLALCGRTNKVFTSRARACILAIIQQTHLPSLLPYLAELANHKSVFPRLTAAEGILACLNCFNPPDLEKETRARIIEDFIKLTARDASADVRKTSKEVFKAYKTLMPARVESFVSPLTPVVKKYLGIQIGPSGVHNIPPNAGQRQASRPSSRANNKATEMGQRPASSTLSKPPARLATDDLGHSTKQRQATHGPPTVVPRQRTVSQMQRNPPPRNLHISTQTSSTARRCIVPTSAPTHQVAQQPASSVTRVLPARNPPLTGGPQRPPPTQMKINPPPDRLKVTGSGAKRVPLPSVPVDGQTNERVAAPVALADRADGIVDEPRSKLPNQMLAAQKALEKPRQISSSTKPANGLASTAPAVANRPNKPSMKDKTGNTGGAAPRRHPIGKETRPLVTAARKEMSPTLISLPPSTSNLPIEIPLPPSPSCTPHPADDVQDEAIVASPSGSTDSPKKQLTSVESCEGQGDIGPPGTPITTLLSSIQRGFLFTPSSPLSPPQNYLPVLDKLPEKNQDMDTVSDTAKGPLTVAPFCISLEDNSFADSLDRPALKDLN